MSSHIFRRTFFRSLLGMAAAPLAARAGGPGRFTPDGQPVPLQTMSVRLRIGAGTVTAIHRRWRKEDVPLCRLCDRCSAVNGECLIATAENVPASRTWNYSTVGKTVQPPEPEPEN